MARPDKRDVPTISQPDIIQHGSGPAPPNYQQQYYRPNQSDAINWCYAQQKHKPQSNSVAGGESDIDRANCNVSNIDHCELT